MPSTDPILDEMMTAGDPARAVAQGEPITVTEMARRLDGMEYRAEPDMGENAGLFVVVRPQSDDLMEWYGAFREETGMEEVALVEDEEGEWSILTNECENSECPSFARAVAATPSRVRCAEDGAEFKVRAEGVGEVATFAIQEDGEPYGTGVVFMAATSI